MPDRSSVIRILIALALAAASTGLAPCFGASHEHSDGRGLSLSEARALFAEKSRDLKAAGRAVEAAEADIRIAGVRPNPTLGFGMTSIAPSNIGAGGFASKRIDSTVGISQLIERGDKPRLRRETAQAAADAVRKARVDTERLQRLKLDGAYFDLVRGQERLRLATRIAALFGSFLEAARKRLAAGDIAAVDVVRMEVDTLRAHNDVRAARAELAAAQTALAYLIGHDEDPARLSAVDPMPEPTNSVEPALDAGALAAVTEARPDVRAALARVAAAQRARELALALRTRDITAGVQFERYPGSEPRNSLGVSVSVPLFTNHHYEGEIQRAAVEHTAAEEALERARAIARAEIRHTHEEFIAARDRLMRFLTGLLTAAERAAESAEFAYGRGAVGLMDVLDARRQLAAVRLDALGAHHDYARAQAAWQAARPTGN